MHHLSVVYMSSGTPRPVISVNFRRAVFGSLHSLSHPGIQATHTVSSHCNVCLAFNQHRCQTMGTIVSSVPTIQGQSPHRYPIVNLLHTRCSIWQGTPGHSWSSFLLTMLYLPTHLYQSLYSVARSYTNYRHHSTDSTSSFSQRWISQFSTPSTVSTDRGHQFESTLWRELMELLGLKRIHTTAFHHSYQWPHRVIPSPT